MERLHFFGKIIKIIKIVINNFRIFYLLDTARKDRIGHADVFSIRLPQYMGLPKKALTNYIRHQIAEVFNNFYMVGNN